MKDNVETTTTSLDSYASEEPPMFARYLAINVANGTVVHCDKDEFSSFKEFKEEFQKDFTPSNPNKIMFAAQQEGSENSTVTEMVARRAAIMSIKSIEKTNPGEIDNAMKKADQETNDIKSKINKEIKEPIRNISDSDEVEPNVQKVEKPQPRKPTPASPRPS